MGAKEEEKYWKIHAKWVSRRGKIKRIARRDRDSRNEAEKPFERKYTGTPRTERTAGMCFYGNNFRERKQNFYLVRRYEGSRRVGSQSVRKADGTLHSMDNFTSKQGKYETSEGTKVNVR